VAAGVRPTGMTTTRRAFALVAGLLLFLTACSGSDSGGDDAAGGAGGSDDSAGAPVAADVDAGEAAAGQGAAPGRAGVDLTAALEDRQVVSTATLLVHVADLDSAVGEVEAIVAGVDGLVFAEQTDLRDGARTQITVKVPPADFREALGLLGDLGEVRTQTVSTDDVTDQVVDLDSRIATAAASVERLRELLARADVVRDIAAVEAQLLTRETELETLRGQRRTIEGQIALATIDVTLEAERASATPPPPPDEDQAGFRDGLRGGLDALRTFAIGLSAVAGAVLPWAAVLAVIALLTRRWWRPRLPRPT
jgi:hypothetical protein